MSEITLTILPGWMHTSSSWQTIVRELSKTIPTTEVIDIPGFGVSPLIRKQQSYQEVLHWMKQQLPTNASKHILIGHSFGGRLALDLVAKNQSDYAGLVLIAAPVIYRPPLAVTLKKLLAKLISPLFPIIPKRWRARYRSADYEQAANSPLRTLFLDVITYDQSEMLKKLSLPVLILWGDQDKQASPTLVAELVKLMPHATVSIIKNSGHDLHLEKPALLSATLLQYVKTI